jgi:hypothetical protein
MDGVMFSAAATNDASEAKMPEYKVEGGFSGEG